MPESYRKTDRYLHEDLSLGDEPMASGSSDFFTSAWDGTRRFLIVLFEKKWLFTLLFLLIFGAIATISLLMEPKFRAVATLELLREEEQRTGFDRVLEMDVRTPEDFNTRIQVLESGHIIEGVAARLSEDRRLLRRFTIPYVEEPGTQLPSTALQRIIESNREIVPVRGSRYVFIEYVHPNPEVAAFLANVIIDEYLAYNAKLRRESARNAVNDLRAQAAAQLDRVKEIEYQLAEFKEDNSSISLDHGSDVNEQELLLLNSILTDVRQEFDRAEARWTMVDAAQARGEPLEEIGFLVSSDNVQELLRNRSLLRIEQSRLAERYRPAHPMMVEVERALLEVEVQLSEALQAEVAVVGNEYRLATNRFMRTQQRIDEVLNENYALDRLRPEYSSLVRKLEVNDEMYRQLYNRMQEAEAQLVEDTTSGRVVDRAAPPLHPFAPSHFLNFALGIFLGLIGGCVFVFLSMVLDTRIKSVGDVELSLGLPLLGVVPSLDDVEQENRSRLASAESANSVAVESFRSILSSLRLNAQGRAAQIVVTTSTLPGEGKSLISSNLALTQASLGDRTLLVDVDLRLPRVAKNLQIDDSKGGLISLLQGEASFEEVVVRDYAPNFDVLPTGGRFANPQFLFNQREFGAFIKKIRNEYDRIFMDATPLAPISDVMSLFSHVDGVVYVVHFGKVNRNTARSNLRRLSDADKPVIGAILNNVSFKSADYYHPGYYDRRYSGYYHSAATEESTPARNGHRTHKEVSPS